MRLGHLWLAAVLALGACASMPTVYQPASGPGAVGYTETPIENDRWRVSFHGGGGANVQRVGDLALQRAAELTLAKGYDWFRVTEREVEGGGGGARPTVSLGMGSTNFGGGTAFGAGGGLGFEVGGGAGASVTLEVLMGHGPTPREPDAYDAREVRKRFGAAA